MRFPMERASAPEAAASSPRWATRIRIGCGSITEWLVRRFAAAAEGDHGSAGQVERPSLLVDENEVPFDANRAVVADRDFGGHASSVAISVAAPRSGRQRRVYFPQWL